MAINPLNCNQWFKTEKHNACRTHGVYERALEQATCIYGSTIAYYPVSEYSLNSLTSLWGEDVNKKYLEKYTLKAIEESHNDGVTFNQFGIDRTTAERTIYIPKKTFREVTGKSDPLTSDNFLWYQNKVIYEVIDITDDEVKVLGEEMFWKLTATPRIVAGEIYGNGDDFTRPDLVDPECISDTVDGDGNVIDDPSVQVPGPTGLTGDNDNIDDLADEVIIRKEAEWGNW